VSVGCLATDNDGVSGLESHIDELYQGPLETFVASRAALAKTLKGAEAQRVKALAKPTIVPWAVNQVYWQARELYERLMRSGEKLRAAQVAALEGRKADVRAATQAHREAIAKAVAKAVQIAAAAGAHPAADDIGRTLEALSLARDRPEHPGRLTGALALAGFEALGGVAVKGPVALPAAPNTRDQSGTPLAREAQRAREREQAAAARRRMAAIAKAETAVGQATAAEAAARKRWEETKRSLETAEQALSAARESDSD